MASSSEFSMNDFCRKSDKDVYEKRARKRLAEEQDGEAPPPIKRKVLHHRDYKVDLESKLGETIFITNTTPQAEMSGYHCNVCNCVVKYCFDFFKHIIGRKHRRNLGMSKGAVREWTDQRNLDMFMGAMGAYTDQRNLDMFMGAECSSLDLVKKTMEEKMKEWREKEEEAKAYKREKQKRRRNRKRRAEEDLDVEVDEEMVETI